MPFESDCRRRRSIRLRGYDYTRAGVYFVTICTQGRELFFIDEAQRQIAEECWLAIPDFNPGVDLDEWVVMPNHLHGIIVFAGGEGNRVFCKTPLQKQFRQMVRAHGARRTGFLSCRRIAERWDR